MIISMKSTHGSVPFKHSEVRLYIKNLLTFLNFKSLFYFQIKKIIGHRLKCQKDDNNTCTMKYIDLKMKKI